MGVCLNRHADGDGSGVVVVGLVVVVGGGAGVGPTDAHLHWPDRRETRRQGLTLMVTERNKAGRRREEKAQCQGHAPAESNHDGAGMQLDRAAGSVAGKDGLGQAGRGGEPRVWLGGGSGGMRLGPRRTHSTATQPASAGGRPRILDHGRKTGARRRREGGGGGGKEGGMKERRRDGSGSPSVGCVGCKARERRRSSSKAVAAGRDTGEQRQRQRKRLNRCRLVAVAPLLLLRSALHGNRDSRSAKPSSTAPPPASAPPPPPPPQPPAPLCPTRWPS